MIDSNTILIMSDKEAADILRSMISGFALTTGRGNGKSMSALRVLFAMHKAIQRLDPDTGQHNKPKPNSKPKVGECRCLCCGLVVKDGKIFPRKDDPTKGLCYDCY